MRPKRSADEVIQAIDGSGAIKAVCAQRLGVSRATFDSYLARWPSVQAAFESERNNTLDLCESVVINNVRAARRQQESAPHAIVDSGDAKWLLSRLGRDRGYSDRHEVALEGEEGGDIPIAIVSAENLAKLGGKIDYRAALPAIAPDDNS